MDDFRRRTPMEGFSRPQDQDTEGHAALKATEDDDTEGHALLK